MGRFAVAAFFLFMLQLGLEHAEGQNRISAASGGQSSKMTEYRTDCVMKKSQSDLGSQVPGTSTSNDMSCEE